MRLHITPLNNDLLPIVLGPGLAKSAENVSYQSIETFPENNYGYLDLPEQDAKKLIAKLNGAILKGKRMKVEEARPRKRSRKTAEAEEPAEHEEPRKKSKKSRKGPEERDVLQGHELPSDRKVKRGWTESKSEKTSSREDKSKDKSKDKKKSKSQAPSKYTEKEELLFRTNLPPNKEDLRTAKKDKKSKKSHSAGTVIHEFEKTAPQPSFLRDTTSAGRAAEYVENIGWVDDKGEVVEKEPPSLKRKKAAKAQVLTIDVLPLNGPRKEHVPPKQRLPAKSTSSSTSDPVESAISDKEENVGVLDDETSSSGITSSSGSATEAESEAESTLANEHRGEPPLSSHTEVQAAPETPPKVHPLEALFKKPKPPTGDDAAKPSLEIETSFSFFGLAPEETDELPPMPNTPFTSQDIYSRGVRSAAPTPDTAHPSRFTSFASALAARTQGHSDDEVLSEAEEAQAPGPSRQQPETRVESDFEKRFWAERGPNNRAWKANKRAALKEQRQKQNRLRRPRNR